MTNDSEVLVGFGQTSGFRPGRYKPNQSELPIGHYNALTPFSFRQSVGAGRDSTRNRLCHERGEAFQMGAKRSAAYPQKAQRQGGGRLPSVVGCRTGGAETASAGLPWNDRGP